MRKRRGLDMRVDVEALEVKNAEFMSNLDN
jgi:hypothetical protein